MIRALDLLLSAVGLLVLGPLLLVLALCVVLEDGRPVLFVQERVGRGGKPFQLFKFRSMRTLEPGQTAPLVTSGSDSRVTKVGGFLRRHKLDELPQLLNVFFGHMSFVGPRPEVAKFVALYPPEVKDRVLSIRPGLTDRATLYFRSEEEMLRGKTDPEAVYVREILPRKLALQQETVARMGVVSYLGTIFATLAVLIGRPGHQVEAD